jgi:hypothetical protein
VIEQARARFNGGQPAGATRVVSLHEPDARPIRKGRLGKPDRWTSGSPRFHTHDVRWAPINTDRSALDDPQVAASGAFVDMPVADGEGRNAPSPLRSTSTGFRSVPARARISRSTSPKCSPGLEIGS